MTLIEIDGLPINSMVIFHGYVGIIIPGPPSNHQKSPESPALRGS